MRSNELKRLLGTMMMLGILINAVHAGENRGLLRPFYKSPELGQWLLSQKEWVQYPAYRDRKAWDKLPAALKRLYIRQAEGYLDFTWPSIPASTYLEYVKTGSREAMQVPYRERKRALESLVLAELVEGKGRFMDQIINGVWAYCEQTYWGLSAHLTMQKGGAGVPNVDDPTIDLGAGMVGTDLAWTYHFFKEEFDTLNPLINERIKKEITDKILIPFYDRDDFWWMGFNTDFVNNWNPWCNYNVLNCILLIEEDKQKQILGIRKVMRSVDEFINYYHDDGGCEEGPAYWGHAGGKLFEVLELLYQVSGERINLFSDELIRNIGRYIYKAYIADPYFINFADAGARIHSRPGVIYKYGKRINDADMMAFGSFLVHNYGWKEGKIPAAKIEITLNNILLLEEVLGHNPKEPLVSHFWLPDTQVMGARDQAGSTEGFYFAAKGGYNAESHNHNDAGSFVLYYNGKPCLVDAGVGTYTKKTFSPDRYDIWTMQSQYHNLPKINGRDQKFGSEFRATDCQFSTTSNTVNFSAEISAAYPSEADVKSWRRSYQLRRGRWFKISDKYELLSNNGATSINFITSCELDITVTGKVKLTGEDFVLWLSYNSSTMTVSKEPIAIKDKKLQRSWPQGLTRLIFSFKKTGLSGENTFTLSK